MARKWLHSLTGLLASAGLALAQAPRGGNATLPQTGGPAPMTQPGGELLPPPTSIGGAPVTGSSSSWGEAPSNGPHAISSSAIPADHVDNNGDSCYFRAEWLLWTVNDRAVPTFVGAIPVGLSGQGNLPVGAIIPVIGGPAGDIQHDESNGVRLTAGAWMDGGHCMGLEVSGFWLDKDEQSEQALTVPTRPIVVGPTFFDPITGLQTIITPIDPLQQTSSVEVRSTVELYGGEVNVRCRGSAWFCADRLELLAGVRYLQLNETLGVTSAIRALPGSNLATGIATDSFAVKDRFYGGQVGFTSKYCWGKWFADLTGKVALGGTHQDARINGATRLLFPGLPPASVPGGVLAQATNSGTTDRCRFTVLPEVTVLAGCHVTDGVKIFGGFNYLWTNQFLRADRLVSFVDSRAVPLLQGTTPPPAGVVFPRANLTNSLFEVIGLSAGIEFTF